VKKVYFCGEKTIWLQNQLEKSTTNAHESDTAMQEPFQVSSMAVHCLL